VGSDDNPLMSNVAPATQQPLGAPAVSRRRIAANFLTIAGTNILGLVVTILISVYVRRAMGPAAVGQISWAMAAIAYLTVLVSPGLAVVGQRELSQSPHRSEGLVALVLTLQTLLACLVYALVLAVASFELRGHATSVLLAIQGVTLFFTAWNTTWVLQAHECMVAPSLAALAFNVLQLPALMLLVHGPDDLTLYAMLTLPFSLASIIYNVWYLARRRVLRPMRLRPTLGGSRSLVREAWPIALAQAMVLVIANSGTLILGFTDSDDTVGQFASAYRLMLVAAIITAALWNAYFPAFVRTQDRPEEAVRLSREYLGLLCWMGMPMAALGWAEGRHVVELLYGPAFAQAGHYFEWLCLTVALTFVNYGVVVSLIPWGHSDLQFKLIAAGAVLNVAVNGLAVPFYGAWGAVAATIATEALVVVLGIVVRRRLKLFWHPVLPVILPPLACSAAAAAILVALPRSLDSQWWLQLSVAALVIGLCMLAFERQALRHAWRKLRQS
jgi:O-antigen/teichoic acid export membrane protein